MSRFTTAEIRELTTYLMRETRGTWTPTYAGLTTAGTTTYSVQDGRYAMHGSVCDLWCRVAWSAATGTGQASIGGLPFPVPTIDGLYYPAAVFVNGVTFAGSGVMALAQPGTSRMDLFSAASNSISTVTVEAAGDIVIHLRYLLGEA